MTDTVMRYDDARVAFLKAIKDLTTDAQEQSRRALNTSEEHDYFLYLATSFGAVGQAVALHSVLHFKAWERDFCAGRQDRIKKPLEEH